MRSFNQFAALPSPLVLILGTISNLFFIAASWGQTPPIALFPPNPSEGFSSKGFSSKGFSSKGFSSKGFSSKGLDYNWHINWHIADKSVPAARFPSLKTKQHHAEAALTKASLFPITWNNATDRSLKLSDRARSKLQAGESGISNGVTSTNFIDIIAPSAAAPASPAPLETGTIVQIQVQFLDRSGQPTLGHTRPFIITREFDLKPGDIYNQELARQGLDRVLALDIVKQATLALEPTAAPNQVILVIKVVEKPAFNFGFGLSGSSPSALPGPFQPQSVFPGPDEDAGFSLPGTVGWQNLGGNDQNLLLQVNGGVGILDSQLSFVDPWIATDPQRTGYALNLFNQRAFQGVFDGGDRDVDLPGGATPWVHRLGGGIEFFRPLTPDFKAALGLSYQRVSVRDGGFGDRVYIRDELGDRLTASSSGNDDLLILRFAGDLNQLDQTDEPTKGDRFRFSIDQSLPIGDASLLFTRLAANYVRYIPVSLFGFADGPRTLVLNLQAGTLLGDRVPPYEAFDLNSSLASDLGTGSSFVLAAAQYRFPIANFSLFRQSIRLGGVLLAAYLSDLGTASQVLGKPAIVREKPGNSYVLGIGLSATTSIGLLQLQLNFTTEGSEVNFFLGEQF